MATEKNNAELYFEWWIEEIKSKGLVLSYTREPNTFVIADAVPVFYDQKSKKRKIVKSFQLHQSLVYTPDYVVTFSKKMLNVLIGMVDKENQILVDTDPNLEVGSIYQNTMFYTSTSLEKEDAVDVYFDVKPPALAIQKSSGLGSSRDFKYVSRMMYDRYGIIVNKVIPVGSKTCLFCKTFLPKRYRFTDVSGAIRKLKDYESSARNLAEYLELKKINS